MRFRRKPAAPRRPPVASLNGCLNIQTISSGSIDGRPMTLQNGSRGRGKLLKSQKSIDPVKQTIAGHRFCHAERIEELRPVAW
jgi:hypothetical protein